MNKQVVIGCRICKDFYEITNGFIQIPNHLLLLTAYEPPDLDMLFYNNHTCTLCEQTLYITPMLYQFFVEFTLKPFDVTVHETSIGIKDSTNEGEMDLNEKEFYIKGVNTSRDLLTNDNDLSLLSDVMEEFNYKSWIISVDTLD
ncbi:hypothetical protein [Alkalibacillus almallahensis]|uniref:hypothetical protein n=1 Tax=Alkalibacillus almallahensis TaxID=1379154 RepID=UPI00141EB433|nr:hypothetical protein [Alkalibacillus almallahensis]NIK13445.1 hypothetical protein [Alkalibacillus almallahensis]